MLKNKRVVKALTIGLATVLATPSMTAFAAVEDPNVTSDDAQVEQQETNTPVVVSQNDLNQIQAAQDALVEAENKEKEVQKEAQNLEKPFDGMTDVGLEVIAVLEDNDVPTIGYNEDKKRFTYEDRSDSANEFEVETGADLNQVKNELEDCAEELEEALNGENGVNAQIEASEEASNKAEVAAANAAAELLKVDDAKTAADAASTSVAASAQASIAENAVAAAEGYAEEANTEAEKAFTLWNSANEAYKKAEEDAANAKKAAEDALQEGREDANKAVEYAVAAEKVAEGLKAEMETYRAAAEGSAGYWQQQFNSASAELNRLMGKGFGLQMEWNGKHFVYDQATEHWRNMFDALESAQSAFDEASKADFKQLEKNVKDLEKAYNDAQEALNKLKKEKEQAQGEFNRTEDPMWAAGYLINVVNNDYSIENRDASKKSISNTEIGIDDGKALIDAIHDEEVDKDLKTAEDVVALLKQAYDRAAAKAAEANATIISKNTEKGQLMNQWGWDIEKIQNDILSEKTTPKAEEAREAAVKILIGRVANTYNVEALSDGIYKTTDRDGAVRYFKYEVNEAQDIVILDYNWGIVDHVLTKMEMSEGEEYSPEDIEAIRRGLEDGTYYVDVTTIPGTDPTVVGYLVEYNKNTKRGEDTKYDNVGSKGTVTISVKKNGKGKKQDRTLEVMYTVPEGKTEAEWAILDNGIYISFTDYYNLHKWDEYQLQAGSATSFGNSKKNIQFTSVVKSIGVDDLENYSKRDGYKLVQTRTEGTGTPERTVYTVYKGKVKEEYTSQEALEAALAEYDEKGLWYSEVVTTYDGEKTEQKYKTLLRDREQLKDHSAPYKTVQFGTSMEDSLAILIKHIKDNNLKVEYVDDVDKLTLSQVDFTYDCSSTGYAIGGECSVSQGTLKFDEEKGYWVYLKKGTTDTWLKAESAPGRTNQQVKIRTYVYLSAEELKKASKSEDIWRADSETTEVVTEKGAPKYTVIRQVYGYDDKYGYTNAGTSTQVNNINAINKAIGAAWDVVGRAGQIIGAYEHYDDVLEKYKNAQKKLAEKEKAYNDKVKAVDAEKYPAKIEAAKKALNDAKAEYRTASANLNKAKNNMFWADVAARNARFALDDVTRRINENNKAIRIQRKAKNGIKEQLDAANIALNYWTLKANEANQLELDAEEARKLAEAARTKVNEITLSDIGADALKAAKAELAIAEAAYKAAQEKAAVAAENAKEAARVYQQILTRVQALIDAENAAAGAGEGEGAGAGETTTGGAVVLATIPTGEEVPGAPAAPVAGGAGVAANAAPAAAEATTVDIAPQNSALAATVPEDNKSDDGLATILPQGPALAADIADTEHLTWWWLLVVAVLGGTGYAMYKKFQTKKEEKVTK